MGKLDGPKRKEKGIRNGDGRGPSGDGPPKPLESAPVEDPRFTRMHFDPRFRRLPKSKAKVSIDGRFSGMFKSKGFADSSVDKKGKRTKNKSEANLLRRYYRVDDDEEEEVLDSNSQVDKSGAKKKSKKRNLARLDAKEISELDKESEEGSLRGRGGSPSGKLGSLETGPSEQDSEDEGSALDEEDDDEEAQSSSSSSSSDSEIDVEQECGDDENEEKIPLTTVETKRLAVMNMDWKHMKAVHLLVLMRSFLPKGGHVSGVSIYPSEFGIQQMEEENVDGPKSIFGKNNEDEDDEEGADPEKLRAYELAKLRYYYAVVDCDSISTAAHLYNNFDGLEFERTSNTLDLRYIPDDMEFKREPCDVVTEMPVDFKPVEFETRALQHSNVKLTWDDDEPDRVKTLRRNFNRDELIETDFQAYVASSSESESEPDEDVNAAANGDAEQKSENDKEKLRSRYLSLLDATDENGKIHGKKSEKGNIQIKFNTGLEELSKKLLMKRKKRDGDETVWQTYLNKKKEKKNAKKKNTVVDSDISDENSDGGVSGRDDPFFSHGNEDPFDDPFFNQGDEGGVGKKSKKVKDGKEQKMKSLKGSHKEEKKNAVVKDKKEVERKQAELELLLLDDHMVENGLEARKRPSLEQSQKKKLEKKKKKQKGQELLEKVPSTVNYEDPRFSSLFTSSHLPLIPQILISKKTGSHVDTIAKVQQQRLQLYKDAQEILDANCSNDGEEVRDGKRNAELSALVRSLQSKVKQKGIKPWDISVDGNLQILIDPRLRCLRYSLVLYLILP